MKKSSRVKQGDLSGQHHLEMILSAMSARNRIVEQAVWAVAQSRWNRPLESSFLLNSEIFCWYHSAVAVLSKRWDQLFHLSFKHTTCPLSGHARVICGIIRVLIYPNSIILAINKFRQLEPVCLWRKSNTSSHSFCRKPRNLGMRVCKKEIF